MGISDSKLNFRKAVVQLTTKTQDVFTMVPAAEIRAVREESPANLATLCYKAVEKLVQGAESGCPTEKEKRVVLSCARLLTRILPYIFEDPDWIGFFWSGIGQARAEEVEDDEEDSHPLAESLLLALADLLFCPDFTVQSQLRGGGPDTAESTQYLDSCEYIWEAGVGFAQSPPLNYVHDINRTELLRLLLTCFSEAMFLPPSPQHSVLNPWVTFFCSTENRHALPLFTSLLNVVCAYDPVGYGIPYNHLLFSDSRELLVEHAVQILIVTLEHQYGVPAESPSTERPRTPSSTSDEEPEGPENLFVNYLSRIHREEDYEFVLKGLARLLTNPLTQTYLPNSTKKIQFHQELLVLFWKLCDFNKKFLYFVLKSNDVLDVLVPILYYLNDARTDQARVGLLHIGVFILLLLSGERNFGVRLNKPYAVHVAMDVPVFTGTHADLLVLVFHKIITNGHQRLQPLYDCLLTIIANVSPYLKSLSMVASNKLLHLLEVFSTSWFLFSSQQNHQLVLFLLEAFNNIVQYQFDGHSNLVYAIIRNRTTFHQLASLPTDHVSIQKALQRKQRPAGGVFPSDSHEGGSIEGSCPQVASEPGTLKTSLVAMPDIDTLTEKSQVLEGRVTVSLQSSDVLQTPPLSHTGVTSGSDTESNLAQDNEDVFYSDTEMEQKLPAMTSTCSWTPTPDWVLSWKSQLPLQTVLRLLQVLVPQVEKICIDKGLTDESEILKFLQHGTLVGLLPVPHPILIRKYQANAGTTMWFRTYTWGVVYLRNVDPPIWYDTDVRLFDIQRV
ncbi:protein HID1-like isoform X2 [Brienomyrus brachyistius]|uniref:protein HID1-like isoform X2 n=1 Tax=Brienomyrus brachyistius TaxID=42636 RepID=UPI0020B17923|nr:protein HID1-like isoform X2 [Brienomyrus brachyistius]